MPKYVYFFGKGEGEGDASMKDLLGGKGANLAQMAKMGFPVPPGFTISTEVCTYFYQNGQNYPKELKAQVEEALKGVEKERGSVFGDKENPLLFSVRSGARISMPGMMNTVLNLGLNDEITEKLAESNARFAWNSYWRFIFMFADVVMALPKEELDEALEGVKKEKGYKLDVELLAEDWKEAAQRLKNKVSVLAGREIPQDPHIQLWEAVGAVFKSWNTPRAITYRRLNRIPEEWGTAVNVQSMAFGNINDQSASGVGFTRNPSTGDKNLYGEFLPNAQGEDVVAGIRTPQPISELEKTFPECYSQLLEISKKLEEYFKDMQDIEFTIENGKLWMLQTRTGKRTAQAAVRIALDMVEEKRIDKKEALLRIDPKSVESFFRPSFDPKAAKKVIAKGLPASPGAAVGEAVFDSDEAVRLMEEGRKVILVRMETSPDDIHGIDAAQGVLTSRGGYTSHAALVTRGMGKPGIVGCETIFVDHKKEQFEADGIVVKKGDKISIDGTSGEVLLGEVPTLEAAVSGDLGKIMEWADEERALRVFANADTPAQAKQSKDFGAEGIGLCRTEHMFFEESRIEIFQEMILAKDKEARESALAEILPLQKSDFIEIFKAMEGRPVIIRLLDPPLHEFLPKEEGDIKSLAQKIGVSEEELKSQAESLKELNPMLGHRGVRLAIVYPEIYQMQARAIMEAVCELAKEGVKVSPEIMIPLVVSLEEFNIIKDLIEDVCREVKDSYQVNPEYKIGTMIETPRAALLAGKIATAAEFFSFGTNDLTQTTLGISRDDAGRFLPKYLEKKIFKDDPFLSLDQEGVGSLIKVGVRAGREANKDIQVGICGEHGGDPETIEFCHKIELDYVSCSPFRIPVARLAAAQAKIKSKIN
ncbi:MAG: pyruvate, phosphate dikinase [Candidatus Pacebacteria bacterium]|nr:pyruvate, phosphate dikinase [Candidatus Paceibacterota bacterium]